MQMATCWSTLAVSSAATEAELRQALLRSEEGATRAAREAREERAQAAKLATHERMLADELANGLAVTCNDARGLVLELLRRQVQRQRIRAALQSW